MARLHCHRWAIECITTTPTGSARQQHHAMRSIILGPMSQDHQLEDAMHGPSILATTSLHGSAKRPNFSLALRLGSPIQLIRQVDRLYARPSPASKAGSEAETWGRTPWNMSLLPQTPNQTFQTEEQDTKCRGHTHHHSGCRRHRGQQVANLNDNHRSDPVKKPRTRSLSPRRVLSIPQGWLKDCPPTANFGLPSSGRLATSRVGNACRIIAILLAGAVISPSHSWVSRILVKASGRTRCNTSSPPASRRRSLYARTSLRRDCGSPS